MNTVPEMLRNLAELYEERNKVYGDNYKHFGEAVLGMFPHGLELRTAEDWNRIGVLVQMAGKMTRYAQQWATGHVDSLDDLAVYTMMLQELDDDMRAGQLHQPAGRPGWPLETKS
jgi:hypothetical protein